MKKLMVENTESVIVSRMNFLRGLFAVLIVLGHCGRKFDIEPLVLLLPHKMNFVFVCYFFAVSGWSLSYNYEVKTNYLKNFWKRKIVKLALLALETEAVTQVAMKLIFKDSFYFNNSILTDVNWYIYEMIALYIGFWLIYKTQKDMLKREISVWIFSFGVAVFTWAMYKYGSWSGWTYAFYYSTMSFPLGITIHRLMKQDLKIKKLYFIYLFILMGLSSLCMIMKKESFVGGIILHNLFGICCMIILVMALKIIDVRKAKLLSFFTGIATYIYLYQFVVMKGLSRLYQINNRSVDALYVIVAVLVTIIIAFLIKSFNMLIEEGIRLAGRKRV